MLKQNSTSMAALLCQYKLPHKVRPDGFRVVYLNNLEKGTPS